MQQQVGEADEPLAALLQSDVSTTQLACECACTWTPEGRSWGMRRLMLNSNSAQNLYLPEISRTRQTVHKLRPVGF